MLSSTEARLGSEIDVDESNFCADDGVSIYIMSSAQSSLINGDVYSNDETVEVMFR